MTWVQEHEAEARAWQENGKGLNCGAVFDRARAVSKDPMAKTGLSSSASDGKTTGFSTRRNDADRRPARVVRRPNDGPGDMSVRQQIARELREAADRKRIVLNKAPTAAENSRARRHGRKMALLSRAAEHRFGLMVRDACEPLGITLDLASILAGELEFEGLVTREVSGKPGGGRSLTITLTDAGRDYLESGDQ